MENGCRAPAYVDEARPARMPQNPYLAEGWARREVHRLAKCGNLEEARRLFDALAFRDAIAWTALIGGYAQHGHDPESSLSPFCRMQLESLSPDSIAFSCALRACDAIAKGRELHARIVAASELVAGSTSVGNGLICMYARCGEAKKARDVFDRLQIRNVVSWTALIRGLERCGHDEEALGCFDLMKLHGPAPNAVTFTCILKICSKIGACGKGEEVHARIVEEGLLGKSDILGNALLDMYAKCGSLRKAKEVFHRLPEQDLVSWTSLIGGLAHRGSAEEAWSCFERMQDEGFSPNPVTFLHVLRACGRTGLAEKGQELHAAIVRAGLSEEEDIAVSTALMDMYMGCSMHEEAEAIFERSPMLDVVLWNALIAGYARCGLLARAREALEDSPVLDTVSWNGLICGYVQHHDMEEAIECYERMQLRAFSPDSISFASILKACGKIGAANKGQIVHAEIVKTGSSAAANMALADALVGMYGDCGMLPEAQHVFDGSMHRDVVTRSALMAGYAQLGEDDAVHSLLSAMLEEGKPPDSAAFSILLNTCNHSGLVDKGQMYFESMLRTYGIVPSLEHYVGLVDLLGRAGQLERVAAIAEEMAVPANLTLWHSILGACHKWGNLELASFAFDHAVQLDQKDAAAYVSMRNICGATVGMADAVGS